MVGNIVRSHIYHMGSRSSVATLRTTIPLLLRLLCLLPVECSVLSELVDIHNE